MPNTDRSGRILRVALPSPLRRLFDYLAPDDWPQNALAEGVRIAVPFGNRTLIGVLIEQPEQSELTPEQLKTALELIDHNPILPDSLLKLCRWCADYYHHSLGDTLSNALPALLRQGHATSLAEPHWRCSKALDDQIRLALRRAPKQLQAFERLCEHPKGVSRPLLSSLGISSATLRALEQKQLVVCEHLDEPMPGKGSLLHEAPYPLNEDQRRAVERVDCDLDRFHCHLLQGVTGSGKTEVYLHLIEQVLRQDKQALVLVPEIGLTPQTLQRFRQRFNRPVVAMHSGLNDRERLKAWLDASNGRAGILIGTRSSLFTPLLNPGIIIVDEEHDGSYKQQDGLRYNARDMAIYRAKLEQIPIVLGSATPSLESLHNALQQRYSQLLLPNRAAATLPDFQLLDLRNQPLIAGMTSVLQQQVEQHLQQGNQVLLFLNRRGYAPTLLCHQCGWVADCRLCDSRMTLHRTPPHLHCHHCDSQAQVPFQCPKCNSHELNPVGRGTERSEEELQLRFPRASILRIDRDSTRRKDAMHQLLQQIHRGEPGILLGTQMLAKGHHFPAVTLVAILDVDSGLFSTDFRGLERMGQLLLQVAGRAGRADKQGSVAIQTHNPEHPALLQLIHQGYETFARSLLRERSLLRLPPYTYLALLRSEAAQMQPAQQFLADIRQQASSPGTTEVSLLGPIAAPMERRQGRYRSQLLLQSSSRRALHRLLQQLLPAMETHPLSRKIRWSIDVDPQEML
ncbi:primosomal protein N' [Aestuariirhabdus sp. Z084]|uniref:primosomal protein N' n=1 Tax=Aestuariirhabdus haliotis TaxID=2918751 RepID=UPI00201B3EDE|nr:primosomal protein N' [Aestuariirhabdus haliotis]MCL6414961.1 primosomal protein N' [Aestuariirhabdus haliotis]MCL6418893.1 primosomal protein N' [Aestuariirhabdus haliotis]